MDITFSYRLNRDRKAPGYSLGFIDAEFTILLGGQSYFSDPYITIAELGTQLGEWMQDTERGLRRNMEYVSIDHDESILTLTWIGDEKWQITSIWESFAAKEPLSTATLLSASRMFLEQLNKDFHQIYYSVKLDRYL